MPFREIVGPEPEDGLHRVAEHAGWQGLRSVRDEGVLTD